MLNEESVDRKITTTFQHLLIQQFSHKKKTTKKNGNFLESDCKLHTMHVLSTSASRRLLRIDDNNRSLVSLIIGHLSYLECHECHYVMSFRQNSVFCVVAREKKKNNKKQ